MLSPVCVEGNPQPTSAEGLFHADEDADAPFRNDEPVSPDLLCVNGPFRVAESRAVGGRSARYGADGVTLRAELA
jgi:hypothetical protein